MAAYNIGICKSWADVVTIIIFSLFGIGSGGHNNTGLKFLISTNQINQQTYGQTQVYFPAFANTRPLHAILKHPAMSKVKIKLAFLGHLPHRIDTTKILSWKSDLFEIIPPIDRYTITEDSDLNNWQYSDDNIEQHLPVQFDGDILIAVTRVPIEENYYARRYPGNRACLSYHEMTEILNSDNIPLENLILRILYVASFVFRRYGNRIPLMHEDTNFSHDETRECIFDMNGIKTDVIYSLNRPHLCSACVETLTSCRIEKNLIEKVQKELKGIKKGLYYEITDFIKRYPVWTLVISSIAAIAIGLITSFLYDLIK